MFCTWRVKTPLTFLQIQLQICLRDVVKFTYMALRLVPKIFDAIYVIFAVFFIYKLGTVVNPVMLKITHIQYVITGKIICVDDAVRVNF